MASYTQVLVIPTSRYKSNHTENNLEDHATPVQTVWNDEIEDSSGNYSLYTHTDFSKEINLEGSRGSSACETHQTVEDKVHNKYPNLGEWDAVLVLDHWGSFSKSDGCAPNPGSGSDSKNQVAGQTDGTPSVGYIDTYNNDSPLISHELGHMYDGDHNEHRPWGTSEYTTMGNPGAPNCDGGTTSEYRIRRHTWIDCSTSSIRNYIDYWYDKGYFQPQ